MTQHRHLRLVEISEQPDTAFVEGRALVVKPRPRQ
jgi:hypothetical protein